MDSHFASIRAPSALGVEAGTQHKWFTALFTQGAMSEHSLTLLAARSFFLTAESKDIYLNNIKHYS
jgi:hypothetical protein